MEWSALGDKISQLIEEGKRALGREIVVMSERPEDEVDDGMGEWVDDGPSASSSSSMARRVRKRRAHSIASGPPSYPGSPDPLLPTRASRFERTGPRASLPAMGGASARNASVDSSYSVRSTREDTGEWESPHLREFMERARASRLGR